MSLRFRYRILLLGAAWNFFLVETNRSMEVTHSTAMEDSLSIRFKSL